MTSNLIGRLQKNVNHEHARFPVCRQRTGSRLGIWVLGATILLAPALNSAQLHPARSAQQLSRPFSPSPHGGSSHDYLSEAPPLPVRFATLPQRGPSPPDPLEQHSDEIDEPDASISSLGQEWDLPLSLIERMSRRESHSDPSETRSTPQTAEVPEPASEQVNLSSPPSRLLLEMPHFQTDPSEQFPVFELPARPSRDGRLHLPLIPSTGITSPPTPGSSATFRRVD